MGTFSILIFLLAVLIQRWKSSRLPFVLRHFFLGNRYLTNTLLYLPMLLKIKLKVKTTYWWLHLEYFLSYFQVLSFNPLLLLFSLEQMQCFPRLLIQWKDEPGPWLDWCQVGVEYLGLTIYYFVCGALKWMRLNLWVISEWLLVIIGILILKSWYRFWWSAVFNDIQVLLWLYTCQLVLPSRINAYLIITHSDAWSPKLIIWDWASFSRWNLNQLP